MPRTIIKPQRDWCPFGKATWKFYVGKAESITLDAAVRTLAAHARKKKTHYFNDAAAHVFNRFTVEEQHQFMRWLAREGSGLHRTIRTALRTELSYHLGYGYVPRFRSNYVFALALKHLNEEQVGRMLAFAAPRLMPAI